MLKYIVIFLAFIYTISVAYLSLAEFSVDINLSKFDHLDKLMHIGIYYVLVLLWYVAYYMNINSKYTNKQFFLGLASLAFIYGFVIEILQLILTSYRSFDLLDILANGVGTVFAILTIIIVRKIESKRS